MKGERWRISVTAPDWGQDHLSSEAVVAFVDDELAHGPHHRATQHLSVCPECAAQVIAQGQARAALRSAECPSLPSSLLSNLRSIPQNTEVQGPPPGFAVTSDGQFVSVLRPERGSELRRGPEHGELVVQPARARRSVGQRRLRFGTGVAVSGLALGAIALGLPGASSGPVPVPTAAERGLPGGSLLGGSVPTVIDAQLRIAPAPTPTSRPQPVDDRAPRR